MNKNIVITLLAVIFYSCQQTELQFSCDPIINEFVVDNQTELSQISVYELATYELSLQRAIFNSWGPEKKRNAWLDKLNHLLLNEPFEKEEVNHIQKLIEHIDVDYFLEEKSEEELELRFLFVCEWLNYASDQLNWIDQYIAFVVYRLYTDYSQLEAEMSSLESLSTSTTRNSEDCNCNRNNNFCSDFADCVSSGCTVVSGCGWFFSESCDGSCNY